MKRENRGRIIAVIISMIALFTVASSGEEAVFSADGDKIFIAPRSGTGPAKLHVIFLKAGEANAVDIPGVTEPIRRVARTKDGRILCMTARAVFAWKSDTGKVERISDAGELGQFLDMIYHPVTGALVFQVEHGKRQPYWTQSWGAHKAPERTPFNILPARGIPHGIEFRGMAFDSEGAFFFGCDGDLWHGDFRDVAYPSGGELYSYRYAPLAGRGSSGGGNPAQMGVNSIVAAGPWLYIYHYRLGGTGRGEVIRIAKPLVKTDPDGTPDYPGPGFSETTVVYKRALGSATVLGNNDHSFPCIAASLDGNLVYFRADNDGKIAHWIVRKHGVPERLVIRDRTQNPTK